MQLTGAGNQIRRDILYDNSGTISSTNTAYTVLPEHRSRSMLMIENNSSAVIYVEMGSGTATATISGGQVTAVTVGNPGFGYTVAPVIEFLGGGNEGNSTFSGVGAPTYNGPGSNASWGQGAADAAGNKPAQAIAILSGGTIGSITITDPGKGYVAAPYVLIRNSPNDPIGAADPTYSFGGKTSGSGFYLAASGGSITFNGTSCPTSPVSVSCPSTSGVSYTCKWMP
ncbi:MAG: hypothetical protein KGL39_43980 [Patescibacteria group bacterium]|nr:hypothetical protein [Patescibacteria group bacterium]